jgi:predicted AAA+ superfamily ATPase
MTSKDVIQDVVDYWAEEIRTETVHRRNLTPQLVESIAKEEVTVVQGVRRSGKTFMLYGLVREHGGTYVNFEDERLIGFNVEDLDKLLDIAMDGDQKVLYLDEVQEVSGWEKFAHRVHRRMKIFVTGSNSRLLTSDYSRGLVGRTKSFHSHPLRYNEFLEFTGAGNKRDSFLKYMEIGGFPRIVLTGDSSLANEYLDRIIYRDIVGRNDIRHPEALRTIASFLLSNVGKEFSYRTLREVSGLGHESTARDYVAHLESGFLLQVINAYSGSLKKQATYGKKVYAVDPAFISLGKRWDDDEGRVLENIVFNHLVDQGDLFYLKENGETDFLVCEGLRPVRAVGVTFEAPEEATVLREARALTAATKAHGVPAELVSVYPVKGLPEGIENRLAHRYLTDMR